MRTFIIVGHTRKGYMYPRVASETREEARAEGLRLLKHDGHKDVVIGDSKEVTGVLI